MEPQSGGTSPGGSFWMGHGALSYHDSVPMISVPLTPQVVSMVCGFFDDNDDGAHGWL